jgi:aminocarboxymuconate-semialdehyde decarboxylase
VTVVDAHAHVIVPGLGAEVRWDERGQVVELGGKAIRAAVREFVDLGRILEEQDRAGVDRIVLCPWVNWWPRLRSERGLAAMVGSACSRSARSTSGARGARGAMRDGRLRSRGGCQRGRRLPGHDRFADFWAAAEETGELVFVHPTTRGFGIEALNDYYLGTRREPARDHDHCGAHGHGGRAAAPSRPARPLATRRSDPRGAGPAPHTFQPDARSRLTESPVDSIRRFYLDTVTHDETLLRAVVEFAGAERVLLGSDYPFDMGLERPAEPVRALGLDFEDEELILGGNALRLVQGRA